VSLVFVPEVSTVSAGQHLLEVNVIFVEFVLLCLFN